MTGGVIVEAHVEPWLGKRWRGTVGRGVARLSAEGRQNGTPMSLHSLFLRARPRCFNGQSVGIEARPGSLSPWPARQPPRAILRGEVRGLTAWPRRSRQRDSDRRLPPTPPLASAMSAGLSCVRTGGFRRVALARGSGNHCSVKGGIVTAGLGGKRNGLGVSKPRPFSGLPVTPDPFVAAGSGSLGSTASRQPEEA